MMLVRGSFYNLPDNQNLFAFWRLPAFFAAMRAMALRRSGDNALALAFPPFNPPLRANSTAGVSVVGVGSVACRVAISTINFPS